MYVHIYVYTYINGSNSTSRSNSHSEATLRFEAPADSFISMIIIISIISIDTTMIITLLIKCDY